MHGESIVMVKKYDFEILVEISVLSPKKWFRKMSVRMCVSVHIARDQTDGPEIRSVCVVC